MLVARTNWVLEKSCCHVCDHDHKMLSSSIHASLCATKQLRVSIKLFTIAIENATAAYRCLEIKEITKIRKDLGQGNDDRSNNKWS